MDAHLTDEAALVMDQARGFLEAEPVHHNLVLTLLHQRLAKPEPGRYVWVEDGGEVVGVLFQSPLTFHATLTPMARIAVDALVDVLASAAPDLSGINGEAATSAAFAGAWAARCHVPALPAEGQRLYRCDVLLPGRGVDGSPRAGTADDLDLIGAWAAAFRADAGEHSPITDPLDAARHMLTSRTVWFWERQGRPVCMVGVTPILGGAARIGPVFTPRDERGRGFAGALTGHCTRTILEDGAVALLYTQLSNPTSNSVYQRLGYAPVSEIVRYAFG
jgi:predicted GNAT family acetyltransferase